MNETTPVITFVGRSGTGKTTFLEKLIPALKAKGLRLAVLKHDAHRFDMDRPGKDTYRFTTAGADVVAISSAEKFAMVERPQAELPLADVIARLPQVDLILTEGYKKSHNPKIEIHRAALRNPLLSPEAELLAVVTDEPLPVAVPQVGLEDVPACVEVILHFLSQSPQTTEVHRPQSGD